MAVAKATGTAHLERDEPCQDYAAASRGRHVCAVALADGAGSAKHSQMGARIAVIETLKLLRANFDALLMAQSKAAAEIIIDRIRSGLLLCCERHAIALSDLSCTLLFAATDGASYLCGQIGDGRMAIYDSDLSMSRSLFVPHKGEFFNQTVFVTSDRAAEYLSLARGDLDSVGGFALMSDGAEESLFNRSTSQFAPALARMMGWFDSHAQRTVRSAVEINLGKAMREKTSDDLSLALLRVV